MVAPGHNQVTLRPGGERGAVGLEMGSLRPGGERGVISLKLRKIDL